MTKFQSFLSTAALQVSFFKHLGYIAKVLLVFPLLYVIMYINIFMFIKIWSPLDWTATKHITHFRESLDARKFAVEESSTSSWNSIMWNTLTVEDLDEYIHTLMLKSQVRKMFYLQKTLEKWTLENLKYI